MARLLGASPEVMEDDDRLADLLRGALFSNEQITGISVVRVDDSMVAVAVSRKYRVIPFERRILEQRDQVTAFDVCRPLEPGKLDECRIDIHE